MLRPNAETGGRRTKHFDGIKSNGTGFGFLLLLDTQHSITRKLSQVLHKDVEIYFAVFDSFTRDTSIWTASRSNSRTLSHLRETV